MDEELKVSKKNVLEAMESCPEAKEILEKIFPEISLNDKRVGVFEKKLASSDPNNALFSITGEEALVEVGLGVPQDLKFKCFYLKGRILRKGSVVKIKWVLEPADDGLGVLLIPLVEED